MPFPEELNGMEAETVNVEVDVASVKVWGDGFPKRDLRMTGFYMSPYNLTDSFALDSVLDIEEIQMSVLRFIVDDHNGTTNKFSVKNSLISHCSHCVERMVYVAFGQNLLVNFAKAVNRSLLERFLHIPFEQRKMFA